MQNLVSQYYVCGCHGNPRGQSISRYGTSINLEVQEYSDMQEAQE